MHELTKMVSYTICRDMRDFFEEGERLGLFEAHVKEIDLFGLPLDIDKDWYIDCFDEGLILVLEARANGVMIGYNVILLDSDLNHKTSNMARQTVLYVDKEYRGQNIGVNLVTMTDKLLTDMGYHCIERAVPTCQDWSPLLVKEGYSPLETVYKKELYNGQREKGNT